MIISEGPERMRLGLALFQKYPPQRFVELVRLCEASGYSDLWVGSERFYRDPTVMLTLAATNSRQLQLGTFIADPYSEHPALIAARLATLDELSGGRAGLLLRAGGTALKRMGIVRRLPLTALREAVQIMRGMLCGETASISGQVLSVEAARLDFAARADLPIYIATRGTRMLALAGEVADGVMISTFATTGGLTHAVEQIHLGARRAGRRPEELELIMRVDTCIHEDGVRARAAVRAILCRGLAASYPDRSWLDALGIQLPDDLEQVFAYRNGHLAESVADRLPEQIVDSYAWVGTPEQVATRLAAVIAAGIKRITIVPHLLPKQSLTRMIRDFAQIVASGALSILGAPCAT